MTNVDDILISGAGIIGLSLALELRERGAQVAVLDRGEPGHEASSAAAGMLAPTDPETPPELHEFARRSADEYPAYIEKVEQRSNRETDFRSGTIVLLPKNDAPRDHLPLSAAELQRLEPAILPADYFSFAIPEEHSVDPDLLIRALLAAARNTGITIHSHTAVLEFQSQDSQVEVIAANGRFFAQAAVNCQGAWSGFPVRPRKGQMLYVQPKTSGVLKHVVRAPEVYLVPRSSGKILVGATVEDIGYDKTVIPEMIQALHLRAAGLVPELARAQIVSSWAGLRPGTPDNLPVIGQIDKNVFIASGHYRNGILLAPATAKIMADLIGGKSPQISIEAFSPARFAKVLAIQR